MNLDETQDLRDTENSCITGTLVLNENKLVDTKVTNNKLMNTPTKDEQSNNDITSPKIFDFDSKINQKKLLTKSEASTESIKLSNYCLSLNTQNQISNILDGPVSIMPLSIGLNTIGRSNENTICILNKNLSKKHACIELVEKENNELECTIWDLGSLNKTKLNDQKEGLNKDDKIALKINDTVQFGVVKFNFVKMTENQFKEQENKRTITLELSDSLYDYSANKQNKSGLNVPSKLNSLFEIQNTLDDTDLIEPNDSDDVKNETNGKMKLYVADTDPEDNEDESMHLEMSASMINQSTYSTNLTRTSFVIPETLASQESESEEEIETKKETNGHKTNGDKTEDNVIEATQESEATQEAVTDTIIISDTIPIGTVVVQEKVQEVQTNGVENTEPSPIEPSPIIELIEYRHKPEETPEVAKTETEIEKPKETNGESEKSVEAELEPKVNGVVSVESETKQVDEPKPIVAVPEPIVAVPEPIVAIPEPIVAIPEPIVAVSEPVKKTIENDESIIINDDEEEEELVKIDETKAKTVKQLKQEPGMEEKTVKKENGEVIIESTLLDDSQLNGDKTSNVSIISIETTETNDKLTSEKVPEEDAKTVEVAQKAASRRSRRSKVEASTVVATPTSLSSTINEADISNANESVEVTEQPGNKRRSTRGSIIPNNNLVNKTQNTKAKKTAANESIETVKETEDKKELNQSVSSTKSSITNKENEAKQEEPTESKLGRRSSLRIRNNVATTASLARDKIMNKVKETAKSDTPSKRRKTLDAASLKSNKKLKEDDEDEENKNGDEEEEEIVKVKTTKSSKKLKTAATTSKAPIEEENEEDEAVEEEPAVKPKRGYPRRKTIAVNPNDIATAKKETKTKTKSPIRSKNIDTYLYEESSDSDAEIDDKKQKNKRKTQTTTDTKPETTVKKRKSKAIEPEAATTSKTKTKQKNAESESETEKTTVPKQRGRKRKSNEQKVEADNQDEAKATTTPKLFFHSKGRNKQSETPIKSTGESSPTKKSSTLNKPSYSSVMNQSKTNDSILNSSLADGLSPSKKFKLLKAKSSSSENLNNTNSSSDEEESANTNKTLNKEKPIAKIEPEAKQTETAANVTSEPLNKNKNESETSPEVDQTTTKGKKQSRLNNTVKIEKPKVRETARSRLSLQPTTSNTPTRQTSRSKGANVPKIMTTGIVLTEKQQKIVNDLGGQIVTDVKECTHLITNKIRRTYKLLSCLNRGTLILNERWLDECSKNKMFSNTITFALKDDKFEKQHKFTLQTSLTRSKSNPLFKDWKFVIKCKDDDPEMTVDNIKTIIESGSGEVIEQMPTKPDELDQCCIIYDDKEGVEQDTKNANVQVSKILLDNFLNCVLKQSFDSSNMLTIEETN